MKKIVFSLLAAVFLLSLFVLPVQADGIIVPEPCQGVDCQPVLPMEQLTVKYHHVTVTIDNQVAVTHVDQVFFNPNNWTVEGTYIFPLPLDAVVSNFTLWIDGKSVSGKVLDATQARRTYEQIVAQMKDPALLEYIGRGAIQAKVFPIAPGQEKRIELEYSQVLTAKNGLVQYVYPLNTEKFSMQPLQSVLVNVDIRSSEPIRAVYSLSHSVEVNRISQDHVKASYEENNVTPDIDFNLFYSVGETEAFHLMTYRDPYDPSGADGYFLMLLAPKPDNADMVISKDVILVLDHSGSMDGNKFGQAQEAAIYILSHLNRQDRFNIVSFSSEVQTFSQEMQPASQADEAIRWIRNWNAAGNTDINQALLEAAGMAGDEHLTYLIFMTDGLPTWGETNSDRIMQNFGKVAPGNLRLFTFGVGYDVDTYLLDSLSSGHHGLSQYVAEGQNLEEVLSAFYESISTPVLTDLKLEFKGIEVYDIFPQPLPDLFAGSQIVITGRYIKGGTAEVLLYGRVNGMSQNFLYTDNIFEKDNAFESTTLENIPRLWATRKIGYLLSQIRLDGPTQELVDQVVKISVRFGIITPYTSFLVTEPAILGSVEQERVATDTFGQMILSTQAPSSGAPAVNKAADQGAMSQAQVPSVVGGSSSGQVKIVGARTLVLQNGIWIDTMFDPDTMKTSKIPFLSKQYFDLIAANPEIKPALALGKYVVLMVKGKAYEITAEVKVSGSILPTEEATVANPAVTGNSETINTGQKSIVFPCFGAIIPIGILCLLLKRIL